MSFRELRRSRGLTKVQLAFRATLRQGAVRKLDCGHLDITATDAMLASLATALEADVATVRAALAETYRRKMHIFGGEEVSS